MQRLILEEQPEGAEFEQLPDEDLAEEELAALLADVKEDE